MTEPLLTVRCVCSWEVTGTEDEVVAATADHGRRIHNMDATREEILAMSAPASGAPSASQEAGRDPR